MELITKLIFGVVLGAVIAVPLALQNSGGRVSAHDGHEHAEVAQQSQPTQGTEAVVYAYVAQPGDSYALLARKAVQTYGSKFDVKLSLAGIVYAETHLTQVASSPQITADQQVEIVESTVKEWVEQAQNLAPEQLAAWDYYVQFVDFNTNNVGEVRS